MRFTPLATSASLLALTLATATPEAAYAECTVDGMAMNPASNPMSGQTITCANNLDNDGVVNSDADDVTVNIDAPAGGISVTGQAGVRLGDGATVNVAGGSNRPINTSGDNAPGIDVGNGATINIGGQVATSGGNSGAIRTGDDSEVTVDGTVRTGGGMSDAISVGANSSVTLNDGALVTTGNSMSDAILLRGDNSSLTVNSGARVTTSSGMSNPIQVDGNMATVDIAGEVRSSSGNSSAILVNGDDITLTIQDGGFVTAQSSNSNAIEVTGSGAQITLERGSEVVISSGNSVGVVTGSMATLDVAGTISASSSQSQGVVLGDGSTINIMEMGLIETSSSGSQAVLVAEDASTATINVMSGGEIDAVGAQAIVDEGMTDTTVNVSGTIFGGSSEATLDLGGGDDMVVIETGGLIEASSANPAIVFGAGSDTLTIRQADGLTGPGMLGDFGEGMDTLNVEAGEYRSSQFMNLETVNVGGSGGGSGGGGMMSMAELQDVPRVPIFMESDGGTYVVDSAVPDQTVNVMGSGSARVTEGGEVGTINNSGGGSTDVESGGSVNESNNSDGGSTNVNEGGNVDTANNDSGGSTNVNNGGNVGESNASNGGSTNVNEGGNVDRANAESGGSTNVNNGGRVGESRAGNGGSVNVNEGGDGGRVQSDAGGSVNVGSGGRARVDANSGNGGTINFASGSTADMDAAASSRPQGMNIAGATFEGGSSVNVRNSIFLTGSAAGDRIDVGLGQDAFFNGVSGTGVTNANSLSAAQGLDRIAQAQNDTVALDQLDGIVLAAAEDVPTLFNEIARADDVQVAAGSVIAAQGFTDALRAGSFPMVDATGNGAGFWIGAGLGKFDADVENRESLEIDTVQYLGGFEGDFGLPGLDEGRAGIAVGYTEADIDSVPGASADTWNVGLYGGGTAGFGRADLAVSYSRADLEAPGVDGAGLDESADVFGGRAEFAFDVLGDANRGLNLSPFVRLGGTHASFSDFDSAGPVDTRFEDEDFTQGVAGAGLRIGGNTFEAGALRLSAEAAYERVFGDRDVTFGGTVGNTADAFDIRQRVADKDRLAAGAQLGFVTSGGMAFAVRYDGAFGSDVEDQRVSGRIGFRF